MTQIKDAWNQGAMKGNSPAHKNFPDQMAVKTVINRACKLLVRGSDDSVLYADDEQTDEINPVQREIAENANVEEIGFEVVDDGGTDPEPVQEPAQEPEPAKTAKSNKPTGDIPF